MRPVMTEVAAPSDAPIPPGQAPRSRLSSLRLRLAALLLVAIGPSLGAMAWISERDGKARLALTEAAMGDVARRIAAEQGAVIDRTHIVLAMLGGQAEIQDAPADPAGCEEVLHLAAAGAPWVKGLGVASPEGILACATEPLGRQVTIADRNYFRRALAERRLVVSELVANRLTGLPVQLAAYPVIENGNVTRVMLAALDFLSVMPGPDGRVMDVDSVAVVDGHGILATRWPPRPELIGRDHSHRPAVAQAISRGHGSLRTIGLDGVPRVIGFARIPGSDAVVLAGRDEARVLAPIRHAQQVAITVFGGAAALAFLLGWLTGDALLLRGIGRISRAAAAAGSDARHIFAATTPSRFAPLEVRQLHAALVGLERRRFEASARLRAAEAQARSQAGLLQAVMANMEQGVIAFDSMGRFLAANARYRQMMDIPESLLTSGRHYLEIARVIADRGEYGPGDPESLARERWRRATAGAPVHRFTHTRPNGLTFEVAGRPLPGGGFVHSYTDVTEARAAQAALSESERRFRLLAENSGDVVVLTDLSGRPSYVSPAAERVLGWPAEALVGRLAEDFAHPDDIPWEHAAREALRAGQAEACICSRFRRPNGSWLWVEVRSRVHLDPLSGEAQGYVAVIRDATERKQAEARLIEAFDRMERMATTDALTGLANRRALQQALEREWARCMREEQPLSLLMFDVDFFKRFNDRYGHPAGDACLVEVAHTLADAARRPSDVPARHGGEEFALLMPCTEAVGALQVAEQLRATIEAKALPHAGNPVGGVVTVSIGVATLWPHAGNAEQDADRLFAAADEALYLAKHEGRNRVATGASTIIPPSLRLLAVTPP